MANPPISAISSDPTPYNSPAATPPTANPAMSRTEAARLDKMLEQAQVPMARLSPQDRARLEAYYGKVLGDTSAIGGKGTSLDSLANGNWRNLLSRAGVPVPGDDGGTTAAQGASAQPAAGTNQTQAVQGAAATNKAGHKHHHYKMHVMFVPLVHVGEILQPGQPMARLMVRKEKLPDTDDQNAQGAQGAASGSAGAGAPAPAGNAGSQAPAGASGNDPSSTQLTAVGGDDDGGMSLQNQDGEQIKIPSDGGELKTNGAARMSFVAGAGELKGDGSTLLAFENLSGKAAGVSFGDSGDASTLISREQQYLKDHPTAPDAAARRAFIEKMQQAPGTDGSPPQT